MKKLFLAVPVALSLTACGVADTNAEKVVVSDPISDDALGERMDEFASLYVNAHNNEEFSEIVPVSGVATMSGVVAMGGTDISHGLNLDDYYARGQIDVHVNFTTNEVDGIASNFSYYGGDSIDGELVLDADIIRGGDIDISGTLTGTLAGGFYIDYDGAVDMAFDIEGQFMGTQADGLVAGAIGTATAQVGGRVETLDIVFAAN